MSNLVPIKPIVERERVLEMLKAFFGQPILNLQPMQGGAIAQTFSFTVGAQHYVVRFNAQMLINFEKEAYPYEHFVSPRIPIPRVVQLGRLGGVHYAISEKARGQSLLQLPRAEYVALIPQLLTTLDAIHHVKVDGSSGYGIFDGHGRGQSPSWREHLRSLIEEQAANDFYGKWHSLFAESFLEQDLFERLYERMLSLLPHCPEERFLVHGDFGFGNVLALNGHITAVLDWMDARFGDRLYDVAWLDFFSPDDHWRERDREFHADARLTSYAQRILCYQCYIALDGMRFFAKGRDQNSYAWARRRILTLINAAGELA